MRAFSTDDTVGFHMRINILFLFRPNRPDINLVNYSLVSDAKKVYQHQINDVGELREHTVSA